MPQKINKSLLLAGLIQNAVGTPESQRQFAQIINAVLQNRSNRQQSDLIGERQRLSDVRQFAQRDKEAGALAKLAEIRAGAAATRQDVMDRRSLLSDPNQDVTSIEALAATGDSAAIAALPTFRQRRDVGPFKDIVARNAEARRKEEVSTPRQIAIAAGLTGSGGRDRVQPPAIAKEDPRAIRRAFEQRSEQEENLISTREGITPLTKESPFVNTPGGEAGVQTILRLQRDVEGTTSFKNFENSLSSYLEVESLAALAADLAARGQTEGAVQISNQAATLMAKSLEIGRLTDQDIERIRPNAEGALKDRIKRRFLEWTTGALLLPEELAIMVEIMRARALDKATPILQAQIDFRLSPFRSPAANIDPRFIKFAEESLNIDSFLELARTRFTPSTGQEGPNQSTTLEVLLRR